MIKSFWFHHHIKSAKIGEIHAFSFCSADVPCLYILSILLFERLDEGYEDKVIMVPMVDSGYNERGMFSSLTTFWIWILVGSKEASLEPYNLYRMIWWESLHVNMMGNASLCEETFRFDSGWFGFPTFDLFLGSCENSRKSTRRF